MKVHSSVPPKAYTMDLLDKSYDKQAEENRGRTGKFLNSILLGGGTAGRIGTSLADYDEDEDTETTQNHNPP
jgi:hypothetical protein